jgi:hypothetical protein
LVNNPSKLGNVPRHVAKPVPQLVHLNVVELTTPLLPCNPLQVWPSLPVLAPALTHVHQCAIRNAVGIRGRRSQGQQLYHTHINSTITKDNDAAVYILKSEQYLISVKKRSIPSFSETSIGQDWKFARERFVSNLPERLLKYPHDGLQNRILSSWLKL